MEQPPGRKIIVTNKKAETGNIIMLPGIDTLIEDALSIIEREIVMFRAKVNRGRGLDLKEARVLQGYIKALVELSKEARERGKGEDFGNMSDEELLSAMQTLIDKRKQNGSNSQGGGSQLPPSGV